MKLAKKLLVGIVAIALLVSCFALSTSAEAPARPIKDLSSVLEYRELDTYLIEDYENYAEGDFVFESKSSDYVTKPIFNFLMSEDAVESVVSVDGNKALSISNPSMAPVGYKFLADENADMLERIVMSFDFKSGDETALGGDVVVLATLCDYFEDVPLFRANLSGEEKSFTYAAYNTDRVYYYEVTADVAPALNTWYTVNVLYDLVNGALEISVESEGEVLFSNECEIYGTEGIDSLRFYAQNSTESESVVYIDNFTAYDGSFFRDVTDPENALAELLLAIDAYAKAPTTAIEEKLEIAEAYKSLYNAYDVPEGIEKYDEMLAVKNDVEGFRNRTYVDAFIAAVNGLVATEGYYEKYDYSAEYVDDYYAMYPYDNAADYEGIAGMTDSYSDDKTYADAIIAAKELYDSEFVKLALIKDYSENFVKQIEEGYDKNSKNYELMLVKYNLLSLTASKVDLSYRYKDVNPNTIYPTVADAYAEYLALEAKIAAIEANVNIFVPAVLAMDTTQNETVSAESPFLTANFETLYENYLIASTVYKNGTVHPSLDPSTFVGADLQTLVSEFEAKKAYIEARITECNAFVSIINGAEASTYFVTLVAELQNAALYLDADKQYSLEKYEGVEEAIALYSTLLDRVAKNRADAAAYIAAVNEIDLDAGYTALRAKVDAALLLQEDGSVTGIEGIEAADIKLAKALSKVETLEGYSATLINTVAQIKNAKTLAERRALIYTALSVKDDAETSISGVSAAKTELDNAVKAYNDDVAALNTLFGSVVSDAGSVISAAVADSSVAGAVGAMAELD